MTLDNEILGQLALITGARDGHEKTRSSRLRSSSDTNNQSIGHSTRPVWPRSASSRWRLILVGR